MFKRKKSIHENQRVMYISTNLDELKKHLNDIESLVAQTKNQLDELNEAKIHCVSTIKKLEHKIRTINNFRLHTKIKETDE
ncbi:hypothetical protein [Staphylococcus simulans]|uniref:hypothetical protein n=1 Tax=Staphylococcus simulans TaxID=1286 RepID=UPI000D1DCE74|nr:hypothetical protein [Staphylococcus simulans]PTJ09586.1 hypothetical protein BU044_08845 [Staphylococcus simulans]PTJ37695.1 hypothetical protein BU021_12100 [Staphylococcus simulans]